MLNLKPPRHTPTLRTAARRVVFAGEIPDGSGQDSLGFFRTCNRAVTAAELTLRELHPEPVNTSPGCTRVHSRALPFI
jgi:hypothetical protein